MKACENTPCGSFLWSTFLLLLLSPTIAFVHERNACARIHHRRHSIQSTANDNDFGQGASNAEEIQDAYGRTISQNQSQEDFLSDDPLRESSEQPIATMTQESDKDGINLEPLVVCGPSGVGKGTVIESLRKRFHADAFGFSVSHTTRQPRPGEVHGTHYFFTTPDEIRAEIDQGLFVEHAEVHGNYYGTSKQAISSLQSENKITILDIDVQGVKSVKNSGIPCKYVFIAPPSMAELEARLRGRGTETEEAISKRLGNAAAEIDYGRATGNFDQIFVNQDVESTVDEMVKVLTEWFPQLKTALLPPPPKEIPFDFLAESDKMMRFPSVRKGHARLEVRETGIGLEIREIEIHNRAEANGNHHGYYTVDLEEPEGPRGYPRLGKTNPNIRLDGEDADEEKAY